MYIINYGNGDGWQILSTDTRTPAVIAESSTGRFSLEEGSPAVQVWMDMTATDMANIRNCRDEDLNFSAEEIAAHKAFWDSKKEKDGKQSRWDPDNPPEPPAIGHWVVSEYTYYETDSLDHMTPRWSQDPPYNSYCPFKTDMSGDRAPAGCVAIAGSQVLYYLHNTLGVPATMVSSGSCSGYAGYNHNYYNQVFNNYTSTTWSNMNPGNTTGPGGDAEALMIGFIGKHSNMTYLDNTSYTTLADLKDCLLNQTGISSHRMYYNADTVKHYLIQHLPVIIGASNQESGGGHAHCFVIDGYMWRQIVTRYFHDWIPGDNDPIPDPLHQPYYS